MRELSDEFKAIPRDSQRWNDLVNKANLTRVDRLARTSAALAAGGSAAAAGLAQSALQQRTKEAYAAKKDAEFEKANAQAGELPLTEMLALRRRKRDAKAAHAAREAARKQEARAISARTVEYTSKVEDFYDIEDHLNLVSVKPPTLEWCPFGRPGSPGGGPIPDEIFRRIQEKRVTTLARTWITRHTLVKEQSRSRELRARPKAAGKWQCGCRAW